MGNEDHTNEDSVDGVVLYQGSGFDERYLENDGCLVVHEFAGGTRVN